MEESHPVAPLSLPQTGNHKPSGWEGGGPGESGAGGHRSDWEVVSGEQGV